MPPALPVTDERLLLPDRLPTLTEVVELGPEPFVTAAVPVAAFAAEPAPIEAVPPSPAAMDQGQVVAQVLALLGPRIDMLLEARLREALAPALARAADGLIRDARDELSGALRDLVEEAVAQALLPPAAG